MDDLKHEAERRKAIQTARNVGAYLDRLTVGIAKARRAHEFSSALWVALWLGWVASAFMGITMEYTFLMIYVITLIYDQWCFRNMTNAYRKFQGAIEILRLLGYVDIQQQGDRKKRDVFEEGVSMVKGWTTQKKEAQEKVYSPA